MPPPVSTFRLYLLRAGYLLFVLGVGLEMQVWSAVIHRVSSMELMQGAVTCMLCSLSLLALLGLRYPLRMLPLIFWEIGWKTIWLVSVALRQWLGGGLDPTFNSTLFACLFVVIYLVIVPWRYVFQNYLTGPGDPWRSGVTPAARSSEYAAPPRSTPQSIPAQRP